MSDGNDDRLIVNCIPMDETDQERFRRAAGSVPVVFNGDPELFGSMHKSMEVPEEYKPRVTAVIGNIAPDVAAHELPRLEWLQTASAGYDKYIVPGVLGEGVRLSNSTGAYGQAVGEHMFAMMWAVMKNLPAYARQQYEENWQEGGHVQSPMGKRALVIGTGDIGSYFATLAKAVGMSTDGVRRNASKPAKGVDTMHGFDELDKLLRETDVVAMSLPASKATHHLMNAERFALMKPSAIVLNVGRGDGIDCDALAKALTDGTIRGAGLDVTDPEPLPKGHALWSDARCLITPHVAGGDHLPGTTARIIDMAIENVRRYVAGEPLNNEIRR